MNSKYDFTVIRVLRRKRSMTLNKLAQLSGLTYPTVETVETNKTMPSLKTLDAIAGALQMSTSSLVGLAERRLVQRRRAQLGNSMALRNPMEGLETCMVAVYDKAKMIRVRSEKGEKVHVMDLHEECNEFCYILSGKVELRVADRIYRLGEDETIFFDGILDHSYTAIEKAEYVTVHIPKDSKILESLLMGHELVQSLQAEDGEPLPEDPEESEPA
ncbi:MAG: helix-turn-helix domain-containing protein [Phycisphaerae bacterium]|nr:helix-turn-helix domain-containing protein [Phycisphaerae bacterium]